jgi:hypothetical protein
MQNDRNCLVILAPLSCMAFWKDAHIAIYKRIQSLNLNWLRSHIIPTNYSNFASVCTVEVVLAEQAGFHSWLIAAAWKAGRWSLPSLCECMNPTYKGTDDIIIQWTSDRTLLYHVVLYSVPQKLVNHNSSLVWTGMFRFKPESLYIYIYIYIKTKLHGLSPRANYTDRATAACRPSDCQLLRIEGAT